MSVCVFLFFHECSIKLEVLIISKKNVKNESLINEDIRAKEMLVIGPNREQLGLMQRKDALRAASEKNLDLVCVAPQANPIVCRIMDYGKYRYEHKNSLQKGIKLK